MSIVDMKRVALELPCAREGSVTNIEMQFLNRPQALYFARGVRRKYRGAWQRGRWVLVQTSATPSEIERFVRENALEVSMAMTYEPTHPETESSDD